MLTVFGSIYILLKKIVINDMTYASGLTDAHLNNAVLKISSLKIKHTINKLVDVIQNQKFH